MAILLTGASGFVGGFVQRRSPCVALSDAAGEVDLRDAERVREGVTAVRPDAVIHLAAQSFVPASFCDPRETFDVNLMGTLNLLMALTDAGFRGRMLFIGSGDAYGVVPEQELPATENRPLRPLNPYAVSKAAGDALCYQWSQTQRFAVIMTRSFNQLGPGQSERFAISNFGRQIVAIRRGERESVLSVGDIDVTRDYTDVRDAVDAYMLLLERGRNGETYNVCSGSERSMRSILMRMLELAGVEARIEQDASRMRSAEQRRMWGSFEKLRRDTGWQPSIGIDQSLRDILQFWEERQS